MTRFSSPCCPPPRRDAMELAHANILRCVCLISAYVGLPGAEVRVEQGKTLVKYFSVEEDIDTFSGIVDEVRECVTFLVQCGWSDMSIIGVK